LPPPKKYTYFAPRAERFAEAAGFAARFVAFGARFCDRTVLFAIEVDSRLMNRNAHYHARRPG